ncbi:WD40 repeat-containing protein [Nitzschia inconspicua]|uniref:WD40 repeat-containing protein n=1 Tax=Nitzschia inconspicua TaxID=303405 RepID=A0A9K3LRT6_9STRA|nr:WD40 repeat-containing protein [Nitzschia inconspicua]
MSSFQLIQNELCASTSTTGGLRCIVFCPYQSVNVDDGRTKRSEIASHRSNSNSSSSSSNNNNKRDPPNYYSFAACGGKQVFVYDIPVVQMTTTTTTTTTVGKDCGKFDLRHIYKTEDDQEDYYSICFGQRRRYSRNTSLSEHQDVLCIGGAGAKIAIVSLQDGQLIKTLLGCARSIFDLQVCPKTTSRQHNNNNLLCSASNGDVRIWNLDSFACVAIFGGPPDGHVGNIYSVAWHPLGTKIASGGEDGKVSVWNVLKPQSSGKRGQRNKLAAKFLDETVAASAMTENHPPGIETIPSFQDRCQFNPKCQRYAALTVTDLSMYHRTGHTLSRMDGTG